MNKIQQFIKDNGLEFTGTGSGLNSDCVILAGFADYYEVGSYSDLLTFIQEDDLYELSCEASDELERVFRFAYGANYGDFWHTDEAKKMYIF